MSDLQRDNIATFHFVEGEIDSEPGPGIAGFYEGPYYSYYRFPRSFSPEDMDETDIVRKKLFITNAKYKEALAFDKFIPEVLTLIDANFHDEKRHLEYIKEKVEELKRTSSE